MASMPSTRSSSSRPPQRFSAPAETPLIAAARQRRLATVTGLDMLVEQAATSFKLFFGQDAPRDRDAELWQTLKS